MLMAGAIQDNLNLCAGIAQYSPVTTILKAFWGKAIPCRGLGINLEFFYILSELNDLNQVKYGMHEY